MTLQSGTKIGPYEILAAIGAGGMGEVYRARDTRLNRDVAIKILPDQFASDPDRLARFQREAQVLASLNHSNIAHIYGLEQAGETRALVLELVDGPTLADRIAQGPIPVDQVLPIARQIAEALGAAHEQGIVHRDLKPANIKLTAGGMVKVLDFGLAKALSTEGSAPNLSISPTITSPAMTAGGVILGTAAYMSPEQARGRPVDKRADIWAFGCVLYEMLTGSQIFGGDTVSDSLAAILTREPDLAKLPVGTPAGIKTVLRRCLQKDATRRLRDAADIGIEIDEAMTGAASQVTVPTAPTAGHASFVRRAMFAMLAIIVGAGLFFSGGRWAAPDRASSPQWRGELLGGSTVAMTPRISPDGQTLAFTAMVQSQSQVAVMKPQSGNWTVLTSDRTHGSVNSLAWSRDGTKVFFDRFLNVPRGIFTVPVLGGEARLVLEDAIAPEVLPDGSLLVTRINADHLPQLFRFWPDTQRLVALPALIAGGLLSSGVRVFPDGREAVFLGKPAGAESSRDHLYVIDVSSGRTRRIAGGINIPHNWIFPLAVTSDGSRVLFDLPAGNLHRIVAARRDGENEIRFLFSLTNTLGFIDVAPDGSVYVDQNERPAEIVRYSPSSGATERFPLASTLRTEDTTSFRIVPLPDGRVLLPMRVSGRGQIMAVTAGKDAVPFVATDQETGEPMAMLGRDQIVFMAGSVTNQTMSLATVADGRITRQLKGIDVTNIQEIAGSRDGRTIYYVAAGVVWAVSSSGGEPRKITSGGQIAVDPNGRDLIVLRTEAAGSRLVRVPVAGGAEQPVPVPESVPLYADFGANSIAEDGRMALRLTPKDNWFWPAAIFDPRSRRLTMIPGGDVADLQSPGWDSEGRVVMISMVVRSSLWRFSPIVGVD